MTKTEDLNIGLLGSGNRGRFLGRLVHRPGRGSRIVACCDSQPSTFAHCRHDFGQDIFTTTDYRTLLERNVAAVIVATPDFLHEEHALAVLKRGRPLYLEKPMAISIAGCDRILRTALRRKTRLYVGHNLRHAPFVRKMKALIDAGAIGEVKACWVRHFVGNGGDYYFRDWHAERRYAHSLLLQKAAHDLDVVHWLCGGFSRLVNAFGGLTLYGGLPGRKVPTRGPQSLDWRDVDFNLFPPTRARRLNHRIDVEDLSSMAMKLDNGVFATYAQCHYTPDYWRNYTVIGTEGRLENFGDGKSGTHIAVWNRRHQGCVARGDAQHRVLVTPGGHGGADPAIIAEFLRFARGGGATETSPLAARESVAAGCTAAESLRHGGIVLRVPRPAPALVRGFA